MPQLNLVLLNAGYWSGDRTPGVRAITKAGNAYFDIAMDEGVGGLERLIAETSPSRVLFGSHYPFFYLSQPC